MSTNYFSRALMQEMLFLRNMREIEELNAEIAELRVAIFNKQKKHRRCDKEISKNFNVLLSDIQCFHCKRVYASDVALKLHLKLKHDDKSTTPTPTEHEISQEVI
jgi:hypothetical protein